MRVLHFSLHVSADAYLDYYRGYVSAVYVDSEEGVSLQFPAAELRPFVSHGGIQGRFRMTLDDHNKLVSLEQLE